MYLAVPGQVLEVAEDIAVVDFQGNRMAVSTVLTPDAEPDDWVLVHAGFAITKLDEASARQTWSYLNELDAEELYSAFGEERDRG